MVAKAERRAGYCPRCDDYHSPKGIPLTVEDAVPDKPTVEWSSSKPETITVSGGSSVVATNQAVQNALAIIKGSKG